MVTRRGNNCYYRAMKKFDRKTVIESFRTSIPIMVTFVVIGIGYGILMQKHGFGPLWSLLSGFVIYSGTAQFVSVAMPAGADGIHCLKVIYQITMYSRTPRSLIDNSIRSSLFSDFSFPKENL